AVWIHKRPKKQLLAGLWEFIDIPQALDEAGATNLLKKFHAIPTETINLGAARHIFTHKEWHMQGWLFELDAPCSMEDGQWVDAEALHSTYAMAGAISYYRSRLFEYLL
ncbi:MAG: NUDIX domain-containing protein, partial [Peptococcaceae bacterium]|nr:NUDIX domain-containing protein [Peptococcaceae bacterium]